ncbi:MAG: class I SAM-dependent methyltransferase [Pseudomonadota bacterium]
MITMTQDAPFWDQVAPKYAKRPVPNAAAYEATLRHTRSYLTAEDRVLELGAGTGSTALRLAPAVAEYHATDISSGMIAIAREKPRPAETERLAFAVAGIAAQDQTARAYDTVLAFNLLHLVPDLSADLANIRARLRPGGLFVSKTPCLGRHAWHIQAMIWAMRLIGKAPAHVGLFDTEDLDAQIRTAGFEIVETTAYPKASRSHFVVARAV